MEPVRRPPRSALGPGVEFDRIRALVERAGTTLPAHVRVGPGDDAAVLECDSLVVSTDLSVENVHFRRDWLSHEEIGFRAVAAALSDVAAMAAEPLGVLVSVALPRGQPEGAWTELGEGILQACREVGAPLVGGDLSASSGPLVLDVTVLGRCDRPALRSGAEAGDELWVTGVLGGSGGAVRVWKRGGTPDPGLRRAYARPRPRIDEATWLQRSVGLHALIDLSDGLRGDAHHLAAASRVSLVLDAFAVPVHPELSGSFTAEEAMELALAGGEDYELCFAAAPGTAEPRVAAFEDRFGVPLTRIGTVQAGSGVYVRALPGGPLVRAEQGAFDHFADEPKE